MRNLTQIIPYLLAVTLAILLFNECQREPEIVEIKVVDWIEVPVQVREFDTITEPGEIVEKKVVDYKYYLKYLSLKDSVERNLFVKEAVTIREYNTLFEDTIQKSNVYSKVRGTLLASQLTYETKPYKIRYDTVIRYEVKKQKTHFAIGGSVTFPVTPNSVDVQFYPEADLRVKNMTYSGGFDFINQRGLIGLKVDIW